MNRSQGFNMNVTPQRSNMQGITNETFNINGQLRKANEQDGAGDCSENQLDKTKLIINYIPQFATEEDLAQIFGQAGQIENIRIMRDFRTGYSYGFGFVKYTKPEFAAKAIETLNGLNFRVNFGNIKAKVAFNTVYDPGFQAYILAIVKIAQSSCNGAKA